MRWRWPTSSSSCSAGCRREPVMAPAATSCLLRLKWPGAHGLCLGEVHLGGARAADGLGDEAAGGERSAELLQQSALIVAAEVDRLEAQSFDQFSDFGVRV